MQDEVPTTVEPPTLILVLPNTVAVEPFPPAYALPFILELFIVTVVFPPTVPSFPPPYTFPVTVPPEISSIVLLFTPAAFPPA